MTYLMAPLCVTYCNRNELGLQSARFPDRILCVPAHLKTTLSATEPAIIYLGLQCVYSRTTLSATERAQNGRPSRPTPNISCLGEVYPHGTWGKKGSGHFRVKIYSKPEVPVMRQHAAEKQSVFHSELRLLWSTKVLKIDMPRVPRQWSAPLIAPFYLFGANRRQKMDHRCPRLWFSSPGSPSLGCYCL